jgi:hypothetical protein
MMMMMMMMTIITKKKLEFDLKYRSHLSLQLSTGKHFLTYFILNDKQRKLCMVFQCIQMCQNALNVYPSHKHNTRKQILHVAKNDSGCNNMMG